MIRTILTGTIVFTLSLAATAQGQEITWPSPEWPTADPADVELDADRLEEAKDYALSAGGSGMIVRHGKVVLRWGDQSERYDIKSATKSFGATMLGVAIKDGKIELKAPARKYHPTLGVPPEENAETGWLDEITIQHLATQTAGFEKPGGYEKLLFQPGTQWHYSDGGPNWLAECITLQYEQDLEDLMFERVFTPLGIERDDLRWRNNQYRDRQIEGIPRREFGAGIHANVEALSRLGYLYLQKGRWKDQQILSEEFVATATQTIDSVVGLPEWPGDDHGNASDHYGLLWWNNADGALENVPTDAYWAWGLFDSLVIVIPSLDMVVVRGGARGRKLQRDEGADHYDALKPFLGPIVAAADRSANTSDAREPLKEYQFVALSDSEAPYPPSPLITGIKWAPKDEIIRLGRGSDNWGLNDLAKGSIQAARMLESQINFWDITPHMGLLSDCDPNEAYLAADPGERYALYFTNGGSVGLDLSGAPGTFSITWISLAMGLPVETSQKGGYRPLDKTIEGGRVVTLSAPYKGGWIAAIRKK